MPFNPRSEIEISLPDGQEKRQIIVRDHIVPEDLYLSTARAYLANRRNPTANPFSGQDNVATRSAKDSLIKTIFAI